MQTHRNQASSAAPTNGGNGSYNTCWDQGPGGDLVYPGCGKPLKPVCDLDIIGQRLEGIAPQATFGPMSVFPTRQNYCQVMGGRKLVYDNVDPQTFSQLVVQDVTINREPVYGFASAAGLANLNGVSSLLWTTPDGCWCPMPGWIISQSAFVNVYQESGVNREPAVGGLTLTYQIEFYVNGLDVCPAGWNKACRARLC